MNVTVLKLGGELLEDPGAVRDAAAAIVRLNARGPLVVVHGGGRAIDAELRVKGLEPRFADGLRVTDEAALDVVVSVLAGRTNTALVAAIAAAGGRSVGLTGADGWIGLSEKTPEFTAVSGATVDLGFVGRPIAHESTLLQELMGLGYIPVVCSIGVDREGALLNVNADTLAGHLAATLRARSLIIAGSTPGVLDAEGRTAAELRLDEIDVLTASGAAHSGMVAKLAACRHAVLEGVERVMVVSGRTTMDFTEPSGTRIVADRGQRVARATGSEMVTTAELKA
jgi:acetylglutamate kinase